MKALKSYIASVIGTYSEISQSVLEKAGLLKKIHKRGRYFEHAESADITKSNKRKL